MSPPLAARLAEELLQAAPPPAVAPEVTLCLLDFIACALEARDTAPSRAARALAATEPGEASIIGLSARASPGAAAFANAAAGHGLVREDMHAGAVSHLGVVVLPVLLALAQRHPVEGQAFIAAAATGYEVGAALGRALVNPRFSRQWRPTGWTGPLAAVAAGARLLGLTAAQTASALCLAANTVGGLNEWPRDGGDEMFFHPGFAARNALAVLAMAEAGAEGSATALDGPAGLFAAAGAAPPVALPLFAGGASEVSQVFRKALPLCNFAQTPAQAAQRLRQEAGGLEADSIAAITIRASEAAVRYPGCDGTGPFARVLQAKMSIPFCVAAALCHGAVEEAHFALPADPALLRLVGLARLEADDAATAAFPARQGAEVIVTLRDGRRLSAALPDLLPADAAMVRQRCRAAAAERLGGARAAQLEAAFAGLATLDDVGAALRLAEPAA
ncbi:MmgE/PrpD family protein [Pseudoroseomonas cervicalis]|uniref:MmgE/PrpD family protein n=1 Tax=Teichococcus cervicalis TaxID=204525 RepID=UPI0027860778|nr:MmgE/PrpD family protein [Pseudoroseomonas cervicalis]MDQ1081860.1 2-methylcitrate dehydratase PrpD [Pseudoroseomonas cervicalis]